MPLSTFDGEPTSEVHEHYDADGNLTGTTVVTRPGWTAGDRAWALALAEREAGECKRCGGDLNETLDEESWIWEPGPAVVCLRCVALDRSHEKTREHPQRAGMIHVAVKRPRPKLTKRKR